MNLKEIKDLITVMRKNGIKEVSLDQDDSKIRIVSADPVGNKTEIVTVQAPPPAQMYAAAPIPQAPPSALVAPAPVAPAPEVAPAVEEVIGTEIKSPMVGTFYRAPSPDAPPYAEVGMVINEDSVVCIIEAMKLMNEVKSEVRGKIIKVLAENGQPIEFGQPLFLVEPF